MPPIARDFNVVLISIDTLRADHLGSYGYARDTSPNIDRLAKAGVRLNRYIANAGWTMPQHFTLFTGLYPQTHDMIRIQHNRPLSPRIGTLAQMLQRHGYQTQAFSSQNKFLDPRHGYNRGFDSYQWGPGRHRHSPKQTEQVVGWLRERGRNGKFFLFIHNDECHEPFDPPQEFNPFGNDYVDRYDGEILYVDHFLGKWIDAIEELDLAQNTIVLVTSDHGTEFESDHGFNGKSVSLYNPVLRCVFVAWAPGLLPEGRVVENLTETAQVPATILALLGLPKISGAQQRSFVRSLFSDTDDDELSHVCSYTLRNGNVQLAAYEHHAIQTRCDKLIRLRLTAPFHPIFFHKNWIVRLKGLVERLQLARKNLRWGGILREWYDLRSDAGESRTLHSEARVRADSMEAALDEWNARAWADRKARVQNVRMRGPVTFSDSFTSTDHWHPVRGHWTAGGNRLRADEDHGYPGAILLTKEFELPARVDAVGVNDREHGGLFFAVFTGPDRFRYLGVRLDRRSWVAGTYDREWLDHLEQPDESIDPKRPLPLSLVIDDSPPPTANGSSRRRFRLYSRDRLILTEEGGVEGLRLGFAVDGDGWAISHFRLARLKGKRQPVGVLQRVEDARSS